MRSRFIFEAMVMINPGSGNSLGQDRDNNTKGFLLVVLEVKYVESRKAVCRMFRLFRGENTQSTEQSDQMARLLF